MSGRLRLVVTRRAAHEIAAAARWWLENRTKAPDALQEELERAFSLIAAQPDVGARAANPRLAGVRRLQLHRVGYHLYYRVKSNEVVEVLALWHASRGQGPGV